MCGPGSRVTLPAAAYGTPRTIADTIGLGEAPMTLEIVDSSPVETVDMRLDVLGCAGRRLGVRRIRMRKSVVQGT